MRYHACSSTGSFIVVLTVFMTGCESYQAKPITHQGIETALTVPSNEVLQARADELQHQNLPAVVIDDRDGLSPDEAAVLAVLLNPELRAIRDRRNKAGAQLMQARLYPNPTVSADLDTPVGGSSGGSITAVGFGLSYDLAKLITRNDRIAAANRAEESIDLDIAWQEWQVAQAAKIAVIDLDSINKQIAIYQNTQQDMQPDLERMTLALNNGRATSEQLASMRSLSDDLRGRELALEKEQTIKRVELNRIIGLPASRNDPVVVDDHSKSNDESPEVDDRDTLVKGIEGRRLDLLALKKTYDRQEKLVHSAVLQQFPRITVGVRQQRDTDNLQTAGIGISIDLPIFDTGKAAIRSAEADRQMVYDEFINRVFQARSDVNRLLDTISMLKKQEAQARQVRERKVEFLRQMMQSSQEGNVTIASLMSARRDEALSAIRVIDLQREAHRAAIALETVSGVRENWAAPSAGLL